MGELRRASTGHVLVTQHLVGQLLMLRRAARGAAIRSAVDDELKAVLAGTEGKVSAVDHARLRAMATHGQAP